MDDPKQKIGNELNKTLSLVGSVGLFDINILPQRYRRKRIRLVSILPWLLFIVLLGLLYFSGILALEAQAQFKQSQIDLAQVQSALENYQSSAEQVESLENEIEAANLLRDQITDSYQGVDLTGTHWSDTLFSIKGIIPEGISLSLVTQQENQILLQGISNSYSIILDLVENLNGLDAVQNVQIESVTRIVEAEPSVDIIETGDESQPIRSTNPSYSFSILTITSGEEGLP
ncbi:MAG: PilN domain-containing protein [Anaerolineales bacterium]|nr:PilN domain-containing protein [Anaerolineales bacterium]